MSSETVDKIHETATIQIIPEEPIIYSDIIIPFSEFGKKKINSDIYDGKEKIKFIERHPAYQKIFKNEFSNE